MSLDLEVAVAAAGWRSLLPPRRRDTEATPSGAPRLVDRLALDGHRWLALIAADDGQLYTVPLIASGGGVRRAQPGEGVSAALVAELDVDRGAGPPDRGFRLTRWHAEPAAGERTIDVDQTNESVIVGDRAVVKYAFRVSTEPHPAPPVLDRLVQAGFTGTPRPWGIVEWRPASGRPPRLVASIAAYVAGAVDGWTWAVDDLRDAVATGSLSSATRSGARLGTLIADLHLALAPTARAAEPAVVSAWGRDGERDLDDALAATAGEEHALLRRHEPVLRSMLTAPVEPFQVMLVHGDLHVGQVLRSAEHLAIVDFDGNPVVPAAQRTRPQPAALDVAGMVQSIRHAGLVLRRHEPRHAEAAVRAGTDAFAEAMLSTYRARLDRHGHGELLSTALLRPLRLRQVCREFSYAARHLPRWSYVPLAALPELLEDG